MQIREEDYATYDEYCEAVDKYYDTHSVFEGFDEALERGEVSVGGPGMDENIREDMMRILKGKGDPYTRVERAIKFANKKTAKNGVKGQTTAHVRYAATAAVL